MESVKGVKTALAPLHEHLLGDKTEADSHSDQQESKSEGWVSRIRAFVADLSDKEATTDKALWTVVVHFLCNEIRPAILFFLGFQSVLAGTANQIYSDRISLSHALDDANSKASHPGVALGMSVSDYIQCLNSDISSAERSLWPSFTGQCLNMTYNPWGAIALSMEAVTFAFIAAQVWLLVKFCRKCAEQDSHVTFQSGRYIRFTYVMKKSKVYKDAARLLSAYAAFIGLLTLVIGLTSSSPMPFLAGQLVPLLFMVQGTFGFTELYEPAFMDNGDTFGDLRFRRSKLDMLNQSNAELSKSMEQALYLASMEQCEAVDALVDIARLPQPVITKVSESFWGLSSVVIPPTEEEVQQAKYQMLMDGLHPKKKTLTDKLVSVTNLLSFDGLMNKPQDNQVESASDEP